MLVSARPGVSRDDLLKTLRAVRDEVFNLRAGSGAPNAYQWFLSYVDWTNNAVRMLSNLISTADLDKLVLTREYGLLISGSNIMAGTDGARTVNGLVSVALDQRVVAFDDAIKELDAQIKRWSSSELLVLPDSSFYINHPDKLAEADFDTLIGARGTPSASSCRWSS